MDSNGDSVPELHILNAHRYMIYSCKEDELFALRGFFSDPWYYNLLDDGTILFMSEIGNTMGDYFYHFRLDMSGNITDELRFYWNDINENCNIDREDEYVVDGETCNMQEWYEKTKAYIYMDNEGRNQICNQAAWNVLCDER